MEEIIAQRPINFELFQNYQSCRALGKSGTRDTDSRLEEYKIIRHLKPTFQILDIGSSQGLISIALASHVQSVVGVEVHEKLCREADSYREQLGIKNCTFINAPFSFELFVGHKFDLVLSLAVHCWMPDLRAYLSGLIELLSPEGLLLIESHNLQEGHHLTDWQIVLDTFKMLQVLERARKTDLLSYPGMQPREYEREFLLLQK